MRPVAALQTATFSLAIFAHVAGCAAPTTDDAASAEQSTATSTKTTAALKAPGASRTMMDNDLSSRMPGYHVQCALGSNGAITCWLATDPVATAGAAMPLPENKQPMPAPTPIIDPPLPPAYCPRAYAAPAGFASCIPSSGSVTLSKGDVVNAEGHTCELAGGYLTADAANLDVLIDGVANEMAFPVVNPPDNTGLTVSDPNGPVARCPSSGTL